MTHRHFLIQKLSWCLSSIMGSIISWELMGEFFISLASSLAIATANFFLIRYLSKSFPSRKKNAQE